METIRTYIENMFIALPKTEQVLKAKADLLEMMEDKYNALKEEGKTENEAVGHVISEFGNIDELTKELGIETEQKSAEKSSRHEVILSDKEVDEFIVARKKCSVGVAFGVMLMILAPSALMLLLGLFKNYYSDFNALSIAVSVGALVIVAGIALAVLIINGTKMSAYEKFDDKKLVVSPEKYAEVEKAHKKSTPKFAVLIASGFALIAAGVVQLIILCNNYGIEGEMGTMEALAVSILLACISVAIFLFIIAGIPHGTRAQILFLNDDDDDDDDNDDDFDTTTKAGRIGEAVNSALWTVALTVFFVWGFVFHGWSICWIVFPIAAFISGTISTIAKVASSEDKK